MFEGIEPSWWLTAAATAATGAGFVGLVATARLRRWLLCLWVFAPLCLAMATSSFRTVEHAVGLLLLFLLIPTLPWSMISLSAYLITRFAMRRRGTGNHS